MDSYTFHLDDSTRNESFANLSSRYFGSEDRTNRTTKSPANTSKLFKSSILLQSNTNTTLQNAYTVNNDMDHGTNNGQSSIYTQFKIDTNKFIDEDTNLIELLMSFSTICSEQSNFLKEKIQYLSTSRQKY
jgi:hypothetical protein